MQLNDMTFSETTRALNAVRKLVVDGVTVVNAIELVDWSKPVVQLEICDHCGTPGCSSGGCVSIRRAGDYVVLLPAFADMNEGEWEAVEYAPPSFLVERGPLILDQEQVSVLAASAPSFVEHSKLPLIGHELVHAVQWSAPFRMLGKFPEAVQLRRSDVLAVSAGEPEDVAAELIALVESYVNATIVTLRPVPANTVPVTFYLDDPKYTQWPAFARADGESLLLLGDFIAERLPHEDVRR